MRFLDLSGVAYLYQKIKEMLGGMVYDGLNSTSATLALSAGQGAKLNWRPRNVSVEIGRPNTLYISSADDNLRDGDKIRLYRNIRQRYRFRNLGMRGIKNGWIAPKTEKGGDYIEWEISCGEADNLIERFTPDGDVFDYIVTNYCKFRGSYIRLTGGTNYKNSQEFFNVRQRYGVAVVRDGEVVSNIAPFNLKCEAVRNALTSDNWRFFLHLERA